MRLMTPSPTSPPLARRPTRSQSQGDELCRWPRLLLPLPLLPLLLWAVAAVQPGQRQLLLVGGVDQPVLSRPFQLEAGRLGSAQIRLRTELPPDSTMVLAVDLLDGRGAVQLQLDQEGWRERGSWAEEGESGTYDESQSELLLQLRPQRSGAHRLKVVLEEFQQAAAPSRPPLLRLHLEVHNHRLDGPLLLFTALISAVLVRLHALAIDGDCRLRWRRRCDDDRISTRLELGGTGLLRLRLTGRYEKPDRPVAPLVEAHLQVPLRLRLTDVWGTALFEHQETLRLKACGSAEDPWWLAQTTLHLRLPARTDLRVWARLPERPASAPLELEWLELVVEDGVRTPRPVPVIALQPGAFAA